MSRSLTFLLFDVFCFFAIVSVLLCVCVCVCVCVCAFLSFLYFVIVLCDILLFWIHMALNSVDFHDYSSTPRKTGGFWRHYIGGAAIERNKR
jgi:hypothetical protein